MMKDIISQVRKALLVIRHVVVFSIVVIFSINSTLAQSTKENPINDAEYTIINMFIRDSRDSKKLIYERTYFDKGWAKYFMESNLELIHSSVGIPVTISDNELDKLLTKSVMSKIRSEIYNMKPWPLNKSKLKRSARLVDTFDMPSDLRQGVVRIVKPIIVGDIAIYHQIGFNEAPVHILKKNGDDWKIVYTFLDWEILE